MKVSILIPTLNRRGYLAQSLESARRQTHADLEILVSDDGSSDGTLEFVRAAEAEDKRVRLLPPNPRSGLFENVNHLLRHSRGEAFCVLADDDRLSPAFVEKLVGPLRADEKVAASFCDHWLIDGAGRVLLEESERHSAFYGRGALDAGEVADPLTQAMRGSMCMGFSLYRASVFRAELFDLDCGGAADFDYAIRAAQLGALFYVKERLGEYRVHPATTTATRPAYMIDGVINVFSKYSFARARHEELRREILCSKYRVKALHACVLDRAQWWHAVRQYFSLGGRALDEKIVLSLLLALLPRFAARRLKRELKNFRAQFRNSRAEVASH